MSSTSQFSLIGGAEGAIAIVVSAVFVKVSFSDTEAWPAFPVLLFGVGFFIYGCVKAYWCSPSVTVVSSLIALGLVGALTLSDQTWRGFPVLFVGLAASTAIVLAALKAIVAGILERRYPQ